MRENNCWAGCFLFPSIHGQCIWQESRQKKFQHNSLVKWGIRVPQRTWIWMSLPLPGKSGLGNQTNVGQPCRVCFHPKKIKCFGIFLKKSVSKYLSEINRPLSIWIEHIDIVAWDRRWELECCIDTKKNPSWRRALYHFHVHRGRLALCLPLMRRWEHGDFFSLLVLFSWQETLFLFYLRRMCFISWHHQDTYNVFSEPSAN